MAYYSFLLLLFFDLPLFCKHWIYSYQFHCYLLSSSCGNLFPFLPYLYQILNFKIKTYFSTLHSTSSYVPTQFIYKRVLNSTKNPNKILLNNLSSINNPAIQFNFDLGKYYPRMLNYSKLNTWDFVSFSLLFLFYFFRIY